MQPQTAGARQTRPPTAECNFGHAKIAQKGVPAKQTCIFFVTHGHTGQCRDHGGHISRARYRLPYGPFGNAERAEPDGEKGRFKP